MRRILASFAFRDYRMLAYEVPLHQALIYLNARGLDSIIKEIRRKSHGAIR